MMLIITDFWLFFECFFHLHQEQLGISLEVLDFLFVRYFLSEKSIFLDFGSKFFARKRP